MFFRFDYLEENLRQGAAKGPYGSGTYFVQVAMGADPSAVIAEIDALFANGPQRTKTSTEAAFQQSFVSMLGNLPFFLGTIGGAVVFAVFFSVVNAMLISGRQRLRESGILKALGFRDRAIGALIIYESVLLTGLGGILGVGLAFGLSEGLKKILSNFFPNFSVDGRTMAMALAISLGIGVVAGITPMLQLVRTKPTEALRSVG
jgi:putative ABC transport system permease protein